jgi:hypothetical protein
VDYADEIDGASHQVGDVIGYQGQLFLLASKGPAELTPFASAVYKATVSDKPPTTVTHRPGNLIRREDVWPAQWPEGELQLVQGDACAMLVPRDQQSATLRLVRDEVADASPEGVTKGSSAIRVQPGYGALVAPGDFDAADAQTKYLIDANGRAHRVEDEVTLEHLGYAGASAPVIPDPWLELFQTGAPLSAEAAGRQPDETTGAK